MLHVCTIPASPNPWKAPHGGDPPSTYDCSHPGHSKEPWTSPRPVSYFPLLDQLYQGFCKWDSLIYTVIFFSFSHFLPYVYPQGFPFFSHQFPNSLLVRQHLDPNGSRRSRSDYLWEPWWITGPYSGISTFQNTKPTAARATKNSRGTNETSRFCR